MKLSRTLRLFQGTRQLEVKIDQFLDALSESALAFNRSIDIYMSQGASEEFEEKHQQVNQLESRADDLRREIEVALYSQTLIPESRGDVLGLLENLDRIINLIERVLWGFSIEKPDVPEHLQNLFRDLVQVTGQTVESVVLASRAFFRDTEAVANHNHKVIFHEREADKISTKLKRGIFAHETELAHKMQLRGFVENIDDIADWAEDVADRLAIYVIKRTV